MMRKVVVSDGEEVNAQFTIRENHHGEVLEDVGMACAALHTAHETCSQRSSSRMAPLPMLSRKPFLKLNMLTNDHLFKNM